jgi:hypothetical protein
VHRTLHPPAEAAEAADAPHPPQQERTTVLAQKRRSTAKNTNRKGDRKAAAKAESRPKRKRVRILPGLIAAGACMLCLCITMAEYVNPFYLFPTWDQLFTRADSVVGQVGELFGVELDLFPEKNDDPTQIVTQSTVEVHMIDVGQADAILIQAPEANVLIDAGENGCGEQVVAYLKAQGVKVEKVVNGDRAVAQKCKELLSNLLFFVGYDIVKIAFVCEPLRKNAAEF